MTSYRRAIEELRRVELSMELHLSSPSPTRVKTKKPHAHTHTQSVKGTLCEVGSVEIEYARSGGSSTFFPGASFKCLVGMWFATVALWTTMENE